MKALKRINDFGREYPYAWQVLGVALAAVTILTMILIVVIPYLAPHWANLIFLSIGLGYLGLPLWFHHHVRKKPRDLPHLQGIMTFAIVVFAITFFFAGLFLRSKMEDSPVVKTQEQIVQTINDGYEKAGEAKPIDLPSNRSKIHTVVFWLTMGMFCAALVVWAWTIDGISRHQSLWQFYYMQKYPRATLDDRLSLALISTEDKSKEQPDPEDTDQ